MPSVNELIPAGQPSNVTSSSKKTTESTEKSDEGGDINIGDIDRIISSACAVACEAGVSRCSNDDNDVVVGSTKNGTSEGISLLTGGANVSGGLFSGFDCWGGGGGESRAVNSQSENLGLFANLNTTNTIATTQGETASATVSTMFEDDIDRGSNLSNKTPATHRSPQQALLFDDIEGLLSGGGCGEKRAMTFATSPPPAAAQVVPTAPSSTAARGGSHAASPPPPPAPETPPPPPLVTAVVNNSAVPPDPAIMVFKEATRESTRQSATTVTKPPPPQYQVPQPTAEPKNEEVTGNGEEPKFVDYDIGYLESLARQKERALKESGVDVQQILSKQNQKKKHVDPSKDTSATPTSTTTPEGGSEKNDDGEDEINEAAADAGAVEAEATSADDVGWVELCAGQVPFFLSAHAVAGIMYQAEVIMGLNEHVAPSPARGASQGSGINGTTEGGQEEEKEEDKDQQPPNPGTVPRMTIYRSQILSGGGGHPHGRCRGLCFVTLKDDAGDPSQGGKTCAQKCIEWLNRRVWFQDDKRTVVIAQNKAGEKALRKKEEQRLANMNPSTRGDGLPLRAFSLDWSHHPNNEKYWSGSNTPPSSSATPATRHQHHHHPNNHHGYGGGAGGNTQNQQHFNPHYQQQQHHRSQQHHQYQRGGGGGGGGSQGGSYYGVDKQHRDGAGGSFRPPPPYRGGSHDGSSAPPYRRQQHNNYYEEDYGSSSYHQGGGGRGGRSGYHHQGYERGGHGHRDHHGNAHGRGGGGRGRGGAPPPPGYGATAAAAAAAEYYYAYEAHMMAAQHHAAAEAEAEYYGSGSGRGAYYGPGTDEGTSHAYHY